MRIILYKVDKKEFYLLRIGVRYYKKLKCRPVSGVQCPVSGVTIEVLRMYAEHNHILGPTLAYVCMLSEITY